MRRAVGNSNFQMLTKYFEIDDEYNKKGKMKIY